MNNEMIIINKEYENLIPKVSDSDYQKLKESISQDGQWVPIIINQDGIVLDGHHRFKACNELEIEPKIESKSFDNKLLEKKFVIECNLNRRHLNDFQKAELGIPLLEIETILARQRQTELAKNQKPLAPNDTKGKASTQVSKQIGVSTTTFERAKKIIEKGSPELQKKVRNGTTSIAHAYTQIQQIERQDLIPLAPMPIGTSDIIMADPPWKYDFFLRGSPNSHYNSMSMDELKALKIPSAENCILFLWATNPKLKEALELMEYWGFTYKTNLVWCKDRIGTGLYVRGKHELLLIGKKGEFHVPPGRDRPESTIFAKRGKHSEKPKVVYEIIEKMFPNRKYLELFARNKQTGWKSWGNQIEK